MMRMKAVHRILIKSQGKKTQANNSYQMKMKWQIMMGKE